MTGRRSHGIPPSMCRATSRSGAPCGRFACVGSTVCASHGGMSPQAQRAASVRVTLGQLLEHDPRTPAEVLLAALQIVDAAMRDDEARVRVDGDTSADSITRLLDSAKSAHHLARTTIDAGVSVQMARHFQQEAAYIARGLDAGFSAILAEVPVDPRRRAVLHRWALDCASAACTGKPPPERPEQLGTPMLTGHVVADPAVVAATGATSAEDGPVADAAMRKPGTPGDAGSGPQEPAEPADRDGDDGDDAQDGGKPARPAAAERQAGDGDQADDEAEQQRRWANVVAMRRGNSGLLPPGIAG